MTERLAIVDEAAATNPWPTDTQYRRIIHVGGRGHGKTAAMEAMKAEYRLDPQTWADALDKARESFAAASNSMLEFSRYWDYTPAEELRDRLNDRQQGKPPTEPINTRYWR